MPVQVKLTASPMKTLDDTQMVNFLKALWVSFSKARTEVLVTVDLASPLRASFRVDGTVENVEPNSQLVLKGHIRPGYRVTAAGGASLETLDQFKAVIQGLKSFGTESVTVTFRKVAFQPLL